MGLLSSLKRRSDPPVSVSPELGSADDIRLRVRRRLIGAAVLLILAVVGFPLLFDAAPRSVPVDIAIEIPSKDAVAPLPLPVPRTMAPTSAAMQPASESASASPPPPVLARSPAPAATQILTETAADAGREIAAPPPAKASAADIEAARALAALEAQPAPAAVVSAGRPADAAARFVVQVGAFSEANSTREARQKVEKLGLKTYTQVVETAAGQRTRVRVGPFGERAEADRAAAQIKQTGLPAAVLTL